MPTSPLTAITRDLRRLASPERGDDQLLDAFAHKQDESAFTVLVRRYGGLVMSVCRRTLGHEQDAEDAFQATFLVLARNARSIRRTGSLAAWLHGVSYRIAMNAKRSLARRRSKEQDAARVATTSDHEEMSWREVQSLLDEEVARLPEIYRRVFVLCCLHETSKPEAAKMLGLKEGTVSSRLARAKEQLQERLAKRGVTLSSLMVALDVAGHGAKVSVATVKATATGAVAYAAGACASSGVSARVAELAEGVGPMVGMKVKVGLGLVLVVGMVLAPLMAGTGGGKKEEGANPRNVKQEGVVEKGEIKGRVIDPEGKPVKGAQVYRMIATNLDDGPGRPPTRLAQSDADGWLRVPASLPRETGLRNSPPVWLATAPGYGSAIAEERLTPGKDVVLRLVKDAPISGRIVNLEGRPVAGVVVQPLLLATSDKEDMQEFLTAAAAKRSSPLHELLPRQVVAPAGIPGLPARLTTDADGRFRLTGVGRERLVGLMLSGAKVENDLIFVMTRDGKPFRVPDHPGGEPEHRVYPISFQHVVSPPQPLVGTVRDGATGKPVAGAWVDAGMGPFLRLKTGADGAYRLDSLPGMVYRASREGEIPVTVLPPTGEPYLPVMKRINLRRRGEAMRLDFTLTRGTWAEGKVIDKAGKPVRAKLEYYPDLKNPHLKSYVNPPSAVFANSQMFFATGEDGSFRVPVLPGRGAIGARASLGAYLPATSLSDKQTGDFVQLPSNVANLHAVTVIDTTEAKPSTLTLDPGQTLTCHLVDGDGKPVTGARVHGVLPHDLWGDRAWSSHEVRLTALHPKQSRWVAVIHPERQLGATAEVSPDANAPYALRLQPTGTITGRLLDPEGRPWPRQPLSVYFDKPGKGHLMQHWPFALSTDDDGRFRVVGVLPGLAYQVNVAGKPNNRTIGSVKTGIKLASGEVKDLGDLKPRMFRDD